MDMVRDGDWDTGMETGTGQRNRNKQTWPGQRVKDRNKERD